MCCFQRSRRRRRRRRLAGFLSLFPINGARWRFKDKLVGVSSVNAAALRAFSRSRTSQIDNITCWCLGLHWLVTLVQVMFNEGHLVMFKVSRMRKKRGFLEVWMWPDFNQVRIYWVLSHWYNGRCQCRHQGSEVRKGRRGGGHFCNRWLWRSCFFLLKQKWTWFQSVFFSSSVHRLVSAGSLYRMLPKWKQTDGGVQGSVHLLYAVALSSINLIRRLK